MLLNVSSAAAAAEGSDPRGVWAMEHDIAEIQLFTCSDALCGRIVWLASPFDATGQQRRDTANSAADARQKPLCGLTVIEGMKRAGPDDWSGGSIYNPLDGRWYHGIIRLKPDDALDVRAYVGLAAFGKSQTWTRLTSADSPVAIADAACAGRPVPERGREVKTARNALR
jgi:uncharacterized protein (DUF2147 family)